ncbi:AIPR protein [Hoeflea halophila]|uniref:AIPR protein n=1 Tax=Hoeflea halophila TaxID=714899 RepID=A0A286I4F2_9HYPH|nr:AIPR family protein [Hoeflea halophila]SOE14990.1 AIPR protein [Hoeflea halophila]
MQGKIKQKETTIGDNSLRELAGAITQLASPESVQSLIDGGGNAELKLVLKRNNIKDLVEKGYKVVGVFICNQTLDANGREFLDQHDSMRVYDRERISNEYIDVESAGGVSGVFKFDTTYVDPMVIQSGSKATAYILPVQAVELVNMEGIEDGTLFSQNVRQSLGNTKVNKSLSQSVADSTEHQNFPLYHNGVNILCERATLGDGVLEIENYVVVNGAQSISTFKKSVSKLSPDLRVIAKVVQLSDASLSRRITINSNNQNAIKPRDLKSTNEVQIRLRKEFESVLNGEYDLEIKRGQEARNGAEIITNEEAGRLLLAFDLMEPESCHQVYKLFDDKYAEIFARPAVTAWRVILLNIIMQRIQNAMPSIEYKPLSKYGLTRFFLLSVLSELIAGDAIGREYNKDPKKLFDEGKIDNFSGAIDEILGAIIVDLNFEVADLGDGFDYKGDLKSPSKIKDLRAKLLRSFQKDVARGKAKALGDLLAE